LGAAAAHRGASFARQKRPRCRPDLRPIRSQDAWAALNPARIDQGVSSVEPNGSGCGSEPFRLLFSPSLDAAMLLLVSQAMAASNQAAHAPSRMASRTLTRDRGFESISLQRGVRCEPDFLSLAAVLPAEELGEVRAEPV
jgi:hypothetical protein